MDADGRIIPVVEDDQGEGMKDPLTIDDLIRMGLEYKTPVFEELVKQVTKQQEARWLEIKTVIPPVRKIP